MALKVGELFAAITADSTQFNRTMNSMHSKLNAMQSAMKAKMVSVTLPILAVAGAMMKLSSDTSESLNKAEVAFGENANEVKAWSNTTLKSIGLARGSALDMASLFGDMATGMGLSTGQASKMSTSLVNLAGDMASFKNISFGIAETALKSIFTGETESLKQLGVVMTEANLKEFALSLGIKTRLDKMREADKVQLRYLYVLEKTKNSQGDFARTADSAANRTRVFWESTKELGDKIGQNLLPAFTTLIGVATKLVSWFGELNPNIQTSIVVTALLAAAVPPVAFAITTMTSAVLALNAALVPEIAIIASVIAIIGSLALSAYLVIDNWSKVQKLFSSLWEYIKNGFIAMGGNITNAFMDAELSALKTIESISNAMGGLPKMVTEVTGLKKSIEDLKQIRSMSGVYTATINATQNVKGVMLGESYSDMENGMYSTFSKVLDPVTKLKDMLSASDNNGSMFGSYMSEVEKAKVAAQAAKDLKDEITNNLLNSKEVGTGNDAIKKAKDEISSIRDALKAATDSVFKFGDAFQKVDYEKFSPQKLLNRTKKAFEEMSNWSKNLLSLQNMGLNDSTMNELRGMGLSGAGVVKGLVNSDVATRASIIGNINSSRGLAQQQGAMTVNHEYNGSIKVEGDKQYTINVTDVLKNELKRDLSRYSVNPSVVNRYK